MNKRTPWSIAAMGLYKMRSQWAIPTSLGVCLTHHCNLKCSYCMVHSFTPPEGVITLKKMKIILERMPYISGVCIMGLCEPYMNPETSSILRWLKDEGKYSISFTTNGTIPFNFSKMDALRRVDDMAISIDTSNADTFRKLRGADLRKVMAHLIHLITFKRNLRLTAEDRPPIHINAVITKDNFEEIPGLIEMLEPYALDLTYLMLDPCTRPDFSKADTFILTRKPDDFEFYRELAKKSPLKIMGFDWMFRNSQEWAGCQLSWLGPFIHPNGDMYPCYKYDYTLGNVFTENPLRVWNSQKMKEFRKALKTMKPPLEQCHFCNFARTKWQPGGAYYTEKRDTNE